MKYFEITHDKDSYRSAPQIINWYELINVRLINWESYHLLPNRKILPIAPSPETIFTDIVTFPFLLVSSKVKNIIRMYGDVVVFKEIILSDSVNKLHQRYFLPIMEENKKFRLDLGRTDRESNRNTSVSKWIGSRNIFCIRCNGLRHIIINLDMAESLFLRNVTGIKIQEIIISGEDKNEG